METLRKEISAAFPFESKYLDIKGNNIHYIDEGEGDPILFIHGNPTSSYLWRNIIPYLKDYSRCIALDHIGMGKSDKPDIQYGFHNSYEYLESFISQLGLKNDSKIARKSPSRRRFLAIKNPTYRRKHYLGLPRRSS